MCCFSCGVYHHLPRNETLFRFSYLHPARPEINSPRFISFRDRLGSGLRSSVNDTVSPSHQHNAMSFYELLGIRETGSLLEIKQAYKQLARKYHPDVSPPDRIEEYTQRFIQVQEAYETLSDPGRRELYDRDMAKGLHLAFNALRCSRFHEQVEEKNEWKSRWESQLSGLKQRSMHKDSNDNMSWGARMRRERNDSVS